MFRHGYISMLPIVAVVNRSREHERDIEALTTAIKEPYVGQRLSIIIGGSQRKKCMYAVKCVNLTQTNNLVL